MNRRNVLHLGLGTIAAGMLSACAATPGSVGSGGPGRAGRWVMPDEGHPHERTWMAFGASRRVWGRDLLPETRRNLAAVAITIARYEPVSLLVRPDEVEIARDLLGTTKNVELIDVELDDLWIRDSGPVFVNRRGQSAGVDFNFNGWGNKQRHRADARVAGAVTAAAGVTRRRTDLVLEGGALEVDGQGTAIITESCVLNDNRNPGWSRGEVEDELSELLGVDKVIWLPGIRGRDITDGHTDFYARFVRPGVVVAGLDNDPASFDYDVTRRHLDILEGAVDVNGDALQVEVLEAPYRVRPRYAHDEFAAGYINFYVCNDAVIAPEFGDDRADRVTRRKLARLFPEREIVQVGIDGIAAGGGGIHCATQQQPSIGA